MAVPAVYTEKTLADYMEAVLGDIGKTLDLTSGVNDAGSFEEPVNEVLLQLGVNDLSGVTGSSAIRELRARARVEAWKMALGSLAARYNFAADGASFNRSEMHKAATQALAVALQDLLPYDDQYVVVRRSGRPVQDPYTIIPDDLVSGT